MRVSIPIGILFLLASGAAALAECPPCGPDFCLDDPRYPRLLAAKKASLESADYPPDLIALLDRDGACVARVERAPDGFTILLVTSGGHRTVLWSPESEDLAKRQLLAGQLTAYYKFNVRRAFACCKQPEHNERPDWDASLELNTGLAIECKKSGSSVVCR